MHVPTAVEGDTPIKHLEHVFLLLQFSMVHIQYIQYITFNKIRHSTLDNLHLSMLEVSHFPPFLLFSVIF